MGISGHTQGNCELCVDTVAAVLYGSGWRIISLHAVEIYTGGINCSCCADGESGGKRRQKKGIFLLTKSCSGSRTHQAHTWTTHGGIAVLEHTQRRPPETDTVHEKQPQHTENVAQGTV